MKRFARNPANTPGLIAWIGPGCGMANFMGPTLAGLVFLMALAASMPAAAGKDVQARLHVSATVLTMIKVRVVSQPSQINIEQKHISQGYIDIEDASVLQVTSNSPDGFMMSMTHDTALVSHVSARLSQGGSMDGDSMIPVRTQQARDEPMRVSYRLYLNPQAHAGSLPWPVALSFTPRAV